MAQFTKCAELDDWKSHWQSSAFGQNPVGPLVLNSLAHAFVGLLIGAGAGAVIGGVEGAALGAYIGFSFGMVDGFCDQWLNWRLICVKRNQCATGRVAFIETMDKKIAHDPIEWLFDNDLSFNLRLPPYAGKRQLPSGEWQVEFPFEDKTTTYGLEKIVADGFPAARVLQHPKKADGSDWDLNYKGYGPDEHGDHPGGRWTLHCEIEGNGMATLCTIGKVLAVLGPLTAVAGVVAGAVVGAVEGAVKGWNLVHDACKSVCKVPILCDVGCFLAALAAAILGAILGAIVGAIVGAIPGMGAIFLGGLISTVVRHNGDFSDVANNPDSGRIEPEDCVFVKGDQVYDSGHDDGWTEIHPVRKLQKICTHAAFLQPGEQFDPNCCPSAATGSALFNDPNFKTTVEDFWNRQCDAHDSADGALTKAAQDEPVHQWCLHPLVDGCRERPTGEQPR